MTQVLFEVISINRCKIGPIIATAHVKIEIGEVEFIMQNWLIRRTKAGVIVSCPGTRDPITGTHFAAMVIPDELRVAIVAEIGVRLNCKPDR